MSPSGDVASQQADLIVISTLLMLIIIVPVLFLTGFFAWKYRASNTEAEYAPEWDHSTGLEVVIWSVPLAIIIVLSGITYVATHLLDPYTPIERISADVPVPEDAKTLTIEAVALDWKWLFLYPEEGIAVVNEVAAPVDRPIQFKITSGSVMNSLFIPALAGQIYAMAGMQTQLHAVINEPGVYDGFSANYSGDGFSDMRFKFHGLSDDGFAQWVEKVRSEGSKLAREEYLDLEKPSKANPVSYYAPVLPQLWHDILNMCVDGSLCVDDMMHVDANGGGGLIGLYSRALFAGICRADDRTRDGIATFIENAKNSAVSGAMFVQENPLFESKPLPDMTPDVSNQTGKF